MQRAVLLLVFSVATIFAPLNSKAEENKLLVVGSVDVAFKNLTFNPGDAARRTTPLTTINPNLILAYGKWYGSISYDGALAPGSISVMEGTYPNILSLSRSDFLLTFGYRLSGPLSLFGGWLSGNINALQSGMRNESGTDRFYTQTISYLEQGPFFGAAYSVPVGKKSSLNFSAAYASLQGKLDERRDIATVGTTYSNSSFGVSGLSYGVTLTGELNDSMSYRAGIKLTNYRGEPTPTTTNGIIEEYTSIFFGVTNYF